VDVGPSNPYTNVSFDPTSTQLGSTGSAGNELISYSRPAGSPIFSASGVVVTVSKTFNWPYSGPPNRFVGTISLDLAAMQGIDSTRFSVFIGKGSLTLPVRNQTLSSFNVGRSFTAILDSRDSAVDELFGSSSIDPAQIIFFEPGQYSYGFKIFIPDSNQANGVSFKLFFNNLNISMLGTSWGLLGTDQYGRDIFTQLAWGARISLLVGLVASILGIIVGLAVGLLAGYLGKLIDEVLMRLTDLVLVLPGLPLLIVLAATIGPSIWNIILVLGFLGWAGFARIVRSQVLSLRERPFIEASKAAGSGTTHIIGRHILPNVLGLTYVSLALAVPTAIVSEAALAFLGLRDPTIVSWGGMLNDVQGFNGITLWWWVLPPGLSIALLSLSFILLGYALDEILNPRLRMRR
jgi:ABC-type dipeptide/oligopeptide/nickel transport system permease subunit